MADATPTKTFLRVVVSPNSKEVVCIQCGEFVNNVDKRRKLFHLKSPPEKTQACLNLERMISYSLDPESCMTNTLCRSCTEKNSTLIKKMELVKESVNSVKAVLCEKRGQLATKRQLQASVHESPESHSLTASCNPQKPVKRRVTFASASETVTSLDTFDGLSAVKASALEFPIDISGISIRFIKGRATGKLIGCEDHFAQLPV